MHLPTRSSIRNLCCVLYCHTRPRPRRLCTPRAFSSANATDKSTSSNRPIAAVLTAAWVIWWLYPTDNFERLRPYSYNNVDAVDATRHASEPSSPDDLSSKLKLFTAIVNVEWASLPDKIVGFVMPEWWRLIPVYLRKLQREMSMAPGSLAEEVWQEAHDPYVHPEIRFSAQVRVSSRLCDEELQFRLRRKKFTAVALVKYLGIHEKDIHPDDIPVIAVCGSGGGLRALVAGTGSLMAVEEDGLFDCVTYTAGVSGSCWLQILYNSSISDGSFVKILEHIKSRAQVHIAYPPIALQLLSAAPTNKCLLSGVVEKLKGDENADFGLVDVYGLLLAARFLVPRGELGIKEHDFKLSNQRDFIQLGQNPLPIYTAVRHEIPSELDGSHEGQLATEQAKEMAKRDSWFQWFEITPFEFFCEEFSAGIPTWAMGRKFRQGLDVPPEGGFHLPEIRVPFLLGIFGSAFCATLSHYYREIRPTLRGIAGFGAMDDLVSGRDQDLSKVHPITPATLPNFVYGMRGQLPATTPTSLYDSEYIQLMDAGMSNNLPIYPLLRPGRDVDVIIAFDASADIKSDNWLSVTDGYARQRSIKGWPVGIGWPKSQATTHEAQEELEDAQATSVQEAQDMLDHSKDATKRSSSKTASPPIPKFEPGDEESGELGYCTIWVGSKAERTSTSEPPPSKAITDTTQWKLMEPNAGITVIYLPLLTNPKVPGVNPGTTDYLSTWNFVYTPSQVDQVVQLARANYSEGKDQIRRCVRAVYERKKKLREHREEEQRTLRYRRLVRKGVAHKLGEGDHFS